jgi:hypothetical protein
VTVCCPHCSRELTVTLAAVPVAPPEPQVREIDMVEPGLIAHRLDLSEGYTRKQIKRGVAQGLPGFEKRGGRLYAAPEAVKELWSG